MDVRIEYEKVKASFDYAGNWYSGEIICSESESKIYWFVFDQIEVKPFGGSIEFKMVNGLLETVKKFDAYEPFIRCVKQVIDHHRKQLCN